MAYCTVDEVYDLMKEEMLSGILKDSYEGDAEELKKELVPVVLSSIEDAGAEIDGYLAKRYNLPFAEPPRILNKFAKDIAAYNLLTRRGIEKDSGENNYLTRYNAAIRFLTSVAGGNIELGIVGSREAAATGFSMNSNKRRFTRESMGGW